VTSDVEPNVEEMSSRIEQLSLVDLATVKIRELLVAGVIKPGERVREEWLTQRLGISRPPIREAMQILIQQGLLERLPRRGARALVLSQVDIDEIYSLRAVLDHFALRLGVPAKDPALLEPMRAAVTEMRAAVAAGEHARYVDSNRQFHLALIALAGHGRLSTTYEMIMNQMQLLMSINLSRESASDREAGVKRHEVLLTAIESGDLARALAAIDSHGEQRFLHQQDEP
jgi:DNA-binding GntR family transcriptional regulator